MANGTESVTSHRINVGMMLVDGDCQGSILHLTEPLSFWGGLDPETGRIIDKSHPQCDRCVTNRILLLPGTRGSTSSPGVLVESLRLGTGPAGIILRQPDMTVLVAVNIAAELYGRSIPVLIVNRSEWSAFSAVGEASIRSDTIILSG